MDEAAEIYRFLVVEKGHFYVCGDCTMAEHVYQTLKNIIQKYGGMNEAQVQSYMLSLRVSLHFLSKIKNRNSIEKFQKIFCDEVKGY